MLCKVYLWYAHYTGEILCTIHQSVMEEHKQELQPGAVIILRQVHKTHGYNLAISVNIQD